MDKILQLVSHWYNIWAGFFQTNKAHDIVRRYGMNKIADINANNLAGNIPDAFLAIMLKRNIAMNMDIPPQKMYEMVNILLRQLYFYDNCKDAQSKIGRLYRFIWSNKTQLKLIEIKQVSMMISVHNL